MTISLCENKWNVSPHPIVLGYGAICADNKKWENNQGNQIKVGIAMQRGSDIALSASQCGNVKQKSKDLKKRFRESLFQ